MARIIPDNAAKAIDECIDEHDPDVLQTIGRMIRWIEDERRRADEKIDTSHRARLGDLSFLVAKLQQSTHRVTALHQLARRNQYDRY